MQACSRVVDMSKWGRVTGGPTRVGETSSEMEGFIPCCLLVLVAARNLQAQ